MTKKIQKSKVYILITAVVAICLYPLARSWPEIFMAENQKLSAEFTKSYTGAPFDTLRVECWKARNDARLGDDFREWSVELFSNDRPTVKTEGHVKTEMQRIDNEIRIVDVDDVCVVYRYVIKARDNGYAVYTTGTEKKLPYSAKLVQGLLLAVSKAHSAASNQAETASTWEQ